MADGPGLEAGGSGLGKDPVAPPPPPTGPGLPQPPASSPEPRERSEPEPEPEPDARCRRVLAALCRAGYAPIDAADWKNHGIAVVAFAWNVLGRWADADADELETACVLVESGYLPPGQPAWEARADAILKDARFLLRRIPVPT